VIRRVAEEDAPSCARRELVGSGGSEIGVAGTSENSKERVVRGCAKKEVEIEERLAVVEDM
jgi:hypothetical protein